MATDNANDPDSGIASSDVTPINKESSTLTTPEPTSDTAKDKFSAAESQKEQLENLLSSKMPVSKRPPMMIEEIDDEEVLDETLFERLVGLGEMFPKSLRNASCTVVNSTGKFLAGSYSLSRQAVWFFSTTALLLFAPVLFEVERVNAEESIKQDRKKLVLGPGTAMSGGPPMPGMVPH